MNFEVIPYLFLLLAIFASWKLSFRVSIAFVVVAVVTGLYWDKLASIAVLWIVLLGLILYLGSRLKQQWAVLCCYGTFLFLALAVSLRYLSGFNNALIFDTAKFCADCSPFSMELSFEQTIVGFFIYSMFLKNRQAQKFAKPELWITLKTLGILLLTIIPAAVFIGYVRFDFKVPEMAWIWVLNNLVFVCFAEEAMFRGFIQKGLSTCFPNNRIGLVMTLAGSSLLFGLAHFKGGIPYMALSTLAGAFYGFAYAKTNRIEASMLVHFGLNFVHFLFFSYPALAR